MVSSIEHRERESLIPEFVYLNLPLKYASLVLTMPNKRIEIPQNAEVNPNTSELSFKMKNNEMWERPLPLNNRGILKIAR